MMNLKTRTLNSRLKLTVATLLLLPLAPVCAQNAPAATTTKPAQVTPAAAPAKAATDASASSSDRGSAYYHVAMASIYEEAATSQGKPEFINRAIEEYKSALNADPGSPQLNDALADLYFRIGKVREAEATAHALLKNTPDDVSAHKLLGRIYLRQLGEGESAGASGATTSKILDQAVAEFEKIVALLPKSVEDRMVLGQLYTVKHDSKKAEDQFKTAQAIEPESEEVVLNLARLYAESGDVQHAAKVIEDVPENDRTPKMEFTLGAAYDQLKKPKDAIAAYERAVDMEPGDPRTMDALASALLANNQLDEAYAQFKKLADGDPDNPAPVVHIAEIQRRQGKFEDALASVKKARKLDPTNLEAGYNEGLLLDVLGRFDEAAQTFSAMVDLTSHANGAYTDEEKNNRGIFLERLGAVSQEQNKTDQAIAAYQKMIDMGGDTATRGYQGQVDAYRNDKQYSKAIEVSRKAVAADPKSREFNLMLASELTDQNQPDEGITMAKSLLNNTADDRMVWVALGQMNVRLRRFKDAEDAFAKAETLTTKKEDRTYLLFLRGELAERQKHFEPAEQLFKQVLEIDPSNAMTLNYLGYMLADKGVRLPEALKMIRKAVELDPGNGAYLDSLGWVYFKMGQYELAEDNLRKAVDRDQSDPTVHVHMGDLYEKTGRIRQAAAQWELSLSQFTKSAQADVEPGDVAKVQKKLDSARVKLAKQDTTLGPAKPE
jgi:tetratricopeptide (TPR) repeat protein